MDEREICFLLGLPWDSLFENRGIIWSCECKKVVSDILGEIEFLFILNVQIKWHILSYSEYLSSKYLHNRNKMSKNQ